MFRSQQYKFHTMEVDSGGWMLRKRGRSLRITRNVFILPRHRGEEGDGMVGGPGSEASETDQVAQWFRGDEGGFWS